jgi:hypothetical protein
MERPEQITNFEVDEIVAQCERYLSGIELNTLDAREKSYAQHAIFVATMKALYGPDVFAWIASKHK